MKTVLLFWLIGIYLTCMLRTFLSVDVNLLILNEYFLVDAGVPFCLIMKMIQQIFNSTEDSNSNEVKVFFPSDIILPLACNLYMVQRKKSVPVCKYL